MKIIPLSEGSFTVDNSKVFVPFDTQKDDLQKRSRGSLLVEVQPFVVVTSEDIILFDTGLGFEPEGQLQIHENMLREAIGPAQVSKVMLSHLHKDHSGGIGRINPRSGKRELAFPRARYYVQRKELEFAFEKGSTSYITEELTVLRESLQVVLLEGNGVLDGYIKYELTGAHCPYHQVFWVVEGGETAFFGADVAPQLEQMKNRFVAKYDFDGRKSMELRQQWWQQGEKEKWSFLFYHDIKTPVWKF